MVAARSQAAKPEASSAFQGRGETVKKIGYDELIKGKRFASYSEEADYIMKLIEKDSIRPIKNSPKNGKKPSLYTRYWAVSEETDVSEYEEELRCVICPKIKIDYYIRHIDVYIREREYVLALSRYLVDHAERLKACCSENERSFDIWQREKFLSGVSSDGVSASELLRHCGIEKEELNIYRTAEPLAYYSASRNAPQNILILENLDPFYSIRRMLIGGTETVCGVPVGTIIYGGGKRIEKAMTEFDVSAEPYMKDPQNEILYAGDLDYEGIAIYERLGNHIKPCMALYNAMIDKADSMDRLPPMKEQRAYDIRLFLENFTPQRQTRLCSLLKAGLYIPQEILSEADYGTREKYGEV